MRVPLLGEGVEEGVRKGVLEAENSEGSNEYSGALVELADGPGGGMHSYQGSAQLLNHTPGTCTLSRYKPEAASFTNSLLVGSAHVDESTGRAN